MTMPAWRPVLGTGAILGAIAVALPPGTARTSVYALAQTVGVAAVAVRVRRNRPTFPLGWCLVGAATGASTLSNLLWNMGTAPVAAGWLFLAMYPLLTLGLMGLTKAASGRPDRER